MHLFPKNLLLSSLALVVGACTGQAHSSRAPNANKGVNATSDTASATIETTSVVPHVPGAAPVPGELAKSNDLGPAALRRLSRVEYVNTVRQLLGAQASVTTTFADDITSLGYKNMASALVVTPVLAEQYARSAKQLAVGLNVTEKAPCTSGSIESECAATYIQQFGKRVFRRLLSSAEVTRYSTVFSEKRGRSDYAAAIRLVTEAMLQSPNFLYKTELGEGNGAVRTLTGYELATQISYLVQGAPPDLELIAAAETGKLSAPLEREAQVRRLLAAPASTPWVTSFVSQWLGISEVKGVLKDPTAFPSYTPALSAAIAEESQRFIGSLLTESSGSLQALFSADWSFANAELGNHYGLSQAPSDWLKVTLPGTERLGVLTQPAFLVVNSKAADSFPIRRGKILRTRILCGDVPPPPVGVKIEPIPLDPNLTTRERNAQHRQVGTSCMGCHSLMDPLGFGFENYDAAGHFRSTENGKPIDSSGEIVAISPEIDGPFANALEFTKRVAPSQALKNCAALQLLRWAIGRTTEETPPESPKVVRDQALVAALARRFATTNSDLRELLVALVQRDEYRFRSGE